MVGNQLGYRLPNTDAHKLAQQRVGPFPIIRRIGDLAYELDIPAKWKLVHHTISIANLELAKEDSQVATCYSPRSYSG